MDRESGLSRTAQASPAVVPTTSWLHREYRFQKPIAFNGLLTNRILNDLPGPDFVHLLQFLEPILLKGGQDIFKPGESIKYAYFPESAVISHLHFLEDGNSAATTMVGNDGVIGLTSLFDSTPTWCWAEVTIGGNAVRIKPEILRTEFARGGALQRVLLAHMRDRLAQLSQRAVCHGRHIMRERLCTWLLMIQDRVCEQPLALTHERMAQHLGARRAGVSGACNALRDLGIIKYQRGQLRIVNRDLLERLACECYRTLRRKERWSKKC